MILEPKGPLSQRLMVLLSYVMNEQDLRVNWKPLKECPVHFSELFEDIGISWTKERAEKRTTTIHEKGIPFGSWAILIPKPTVGRVIHRAMAMLPPEFGALHQTEDEEIGYGDELFRISKGRVFLFTQSEKVRMFYKAGYPDRTITPMSDVTDHQKRAVVEEAASLLIAAKSKDFKGSGKSPFTQVVKQIRGKQ